MATMDNCHCDAEMENTIKLDCGIKKEEIEEAVRVLLKGLGEDIDRQGLVKTPHRVAKALLDATRGYKEKVDDIVQGALFPEAGVNNDNYKVGEAGGVGGLVIVRDLDLFSLCESCLLPFHVICHVGYVPSGQRVVGLSKLSRVANIFAKRLQHPQRLAHEICTNLQLAINPSGVAVFLECFHIHPPVNESWSVGTTSDGFVKVLVSAGSGVFEDCSNDLWSEFFRLMKYKEGMVDKMTREKRWCPLTGVESVKCDMVRAVDKIIRLLGEDPSRKELAETPTRFTNWLMKFENCDIKMKLNGFISNKNSDTGKTNGVAKCHKNNTIHYEMKLPFLSQCEHHLLPFHGVVHIGYFIVEGGSPINRSLVQKIVHFFGFKLQVQERCTKQIAETIASLVGRDVIVVVEASHTCMISRGIEKFGSSTATIAVLGRFSTDKEARALFLESLPT